MSPPSARTGRTGLRLSFPQLRRIIRHEFVTTVTRPGWILSTVALPLLPLLMLGFNALVKPERLVGGPTPARVGIVDQSGFLKPEAYAPLAGNIAKRRDPFHPRRGDLKARQGSVVADPLKSALAASSLQSEEGSGGGTPRAPDRYLSFASVEEAKKALLAAGPDRLTAFVIVPRDFVTRGEVDAYRLIEKDGSSLRAPLGTGLQQALRRALVADRLPGPLTRRLLEGVSPNLHVLSASGKEIGGEPPLTELLRFLVPIIEALFLAIGIFAGAGYLLLALSEEKENRILEILLSSCTPSELMLGKLVAIGGAGLLQFGLWIASVGIPALLLFPFAGVTSAHLLWAGGFFLGGYLFFGALMLGIGAVADTARHSQQLSGIFTAIAMAPLALNFVILQEPDGLLARVLSFVPFTAPVTVMLRIGSTTVSTLELCLALLTLVGAGLLSLNLASRLFQNAIRHRGLWPALKSLWQERAHKVSR